MVGNETVRSHQLQQLLDDLTKVAFGGIGKKKFTEILLSRAQQIKNKLLKDVQQLQDGNRRVESLKREITQEENVFQTRLLDVRNEIAEEENIQNDNLRDLKDINRRLSRKKDEMDDRELRIRDEESKQKVRLDRASKLGLWVNVFPTQHDHQGGDFICLKAVIRRSRVWFVGETGSGKTTTIGQLLDNPDVTGKAGFQHDTKTITEYQLNYIDESDQEICNCVFTDSRGTSDTGVDVHYNRQSLFLDMNEERYAADPTKVVYVLKNGRLIPEQLDMVKALMAALGSNFMILITHAKTPDFRKDLLELFSKKGISFHGNILCVDWDTSGSGRAAPMYERATSATATNRNTILKCIKKMPCIDISKLNQYEGFFVRASGYAEKKSFELFRVPYLLDKFVPLALGVTGFAVTNMTCGR